MKKATIILFLLLCNCSVMDKLTVNSDAGYFFVDRVEKGASI
jgi:hypothetical protein